MRISLPVHTSLESLYFEIFKVHTCPLNFTLLRKSGLLAEVMDRTAEGEGSTGQGKGAALGLPTRAVYTRHKVRCRFRHPHSMLLNLASLPKSQRAAWVPGFDERRRFVDKYLGVMVHVSCARNRVLPLHTARLILDILITESPSYLFGKLTSQTPVRLL